MKIQLQTLLQHFNSTRLKPADRDNLKIPSRFVRCLRTSKVPSDTYEGNPLYTDGNGRN
jgi:hypothetical protein